MDTATAVVARKPTLFLRVIEDWAASKANPTDMFTATLSVLMQLKLIGTDKSGHGGIQTYLMATVLVGAGERPLLQTKLVGPKGG